MPTVSEFRAPAASERKVLLAAAGPRVVGQGEDGLLKALHAFKIRKRLGCGLATMADVTYELGDNDMRALAHYMAARP
jgi:cytochrome c553